MWLKEVKESITNYKLFSVLIVLFLMLLFSLQIMLYHTAYFMEQSKKKHTELTSSTSVYQLSDTLIGDIETKFLQRMDSLHTLKQMYSDFKEAFGSDYMYLGRQPMGLPSEEWLETFDYGYEEGIKTDSYNSLQLDQNLYNLLDLVVGEGEGFQTADFHQTSYCNGMPVLLGSEYRQFFEVGETMEIATPTTIVKGEIIGFFEENEHIFLNEQIDYLLNRYIVLPSISNFEEPSSEEEFKMQQYQLLNLLGGIIHTKKSEREVSTITLKIADAYEFPHFNIINASKQPVLTMIHEISQNKVLIVIVTVLFMIITIVSITLILGMKFELSQKRWALHMLSGAKRRDILLYHVIELFLLTALPMMAGLLLVRSIYHTTVAVLLLILIAILVVCIPVLFIYRKLKVFDPSILMQKED